MDATTARSLIEARLKKTPFSPFELHTTTDGKHLIIRRRQVTLLTRQLIVIDFAGKFTTHVSFDDVESIVDLHWVTKSLKTSA